MALNFPPSPVDGQLYPDPAQPGIGQWRWSTLSNTWEPVPFYIRAQDTAYNNYIWPTTSGQNTEFLQTNGLGGLTWSIPGGAGGAGYVFLNIDDISAAFNGIDISFPLFAGGLPLPAGLDAEQLFITLNRALQSPNIDYTYAGNVITFSSPPAPGTAFDGRYSLPSAGGTVTLVGTGTGLTGGPISTTGTIALVPATTASLGGVIPDGTSITVLPNGTITAPGGTGTITGVIAGDGLTGGGNTGVVTLNVGAGTGITVNPDSIGLTNTGVSPGTYTYPALTVDAQGRITSITSGTPPTNGTVTQILTGTGLQGGPITTTGSISLTPTGVTAGTYSYATITVDGNGRISAASSNIVGAGTVTQVNTGSNLTGGPITTSGTIDLSLTGVTAGTYTAATVTVDSFGRLTNVSGGILPVSLGGTGASDAPTARANLGAGTVTQINTAAGLSGGPITGSGIITLEPATISSLGGVIPDGVTISVQPNGTISVVAQPITANLQQVTDNGSTTTNSITVAGLNSSQLVSITKSAPGVGLEFLFNNGGPAVIPVFVVEDSGVQIGGSGVFPSLRFTTADLTDWVGFRAPSLTAGSGQVLWTLPGVDGTTGQLLSTNGAGLLSWATRVTSVTAGTGLSGGTITTTGTIALANTAVTPGAYTNANITVDAQGRLTAASSATTVPLAAVPANSGSAGTAGQIAVDATYLYVCRAANTWERIAWDTTPW